jgi:hypothetical protein
MTDFGPRRPQPVDVLEMTFGSPQEMASWLRTVRLEETQVDDYQNINCNGIDTVEEGN